MKQNSLIAIAQTLQQDELFAFSSRTMAALFGLNKVQASQLLGRLEAAGLIRRVERGKHLLLGLSPEQVLSNPLYIGCNLVTPGYISFWSALHYHGFTEQAPQTTLIATTRRKSPLTLDGLRFQFVNLQPKAFFGYRRELHAGLPIVVANEEKAILDSLSLPAYAGGMAEAAKALHNALDDLDFETLVEYTRALGSPSLGSRLGFLLESFGRPVEGLATTQGPVNLDPHRPRQGSYNPRWRIYANIPTSEILSEGVG